MPYDMETTDNKVVALEKAGATREAAYRAIVGGLTATKMTVDKHGEEHFEEDHAARLRSAELIARMNGDLKSETEGARAQVINITISSEEVKGLVAMAADVKAQLEALRGSGQQTGEVIEVEGRAI